MAEKLLTKAEWLQKKLDRLIDCHTHKVFRLTSAKQDEQAARKACEEAQLELNQELEKQNNR